MVRDCVSAHYKLQLTAVTTLSGLLVSIQDRFPAPGQIQGLHPLLGAQLLPSLAVPEVLAMPM